MSDDRVAAISSCLRAGASRGHRQYSKRHPARHACRLAARAHIPVRPRPPSPSPHTHRLRQLLVAGSIPRTAFFFDSRARFLFDCDGARVWCAGLARGVHAKARVAHRPPRPLTAACARVAGCLRSSTEIAARATARRQVKNQRAARGKQNSPRKPRRAARRTHRRGSHAASLRTVNSKQSYAPSEFISFEDHVRVTDRRAPNRARSLPALAAL